MAGALGRHHQHVEILARLDQIEMNVEAMREQKRRALLQVRREMLRIDVALQFVGRQHHHDVGPFGGFGDGQHLAAGLPQRRVLPQVGVGLGAENITVHFEAAIPGAGGVGKGLVGHAELPPRTASTTALPISEVPNCLLPF